MGRRWLSPSNIAGGAYGLIEDEEGPIGRRLAAVG